MYIFKYKDELVDVEIKTDAVTATQLVDVFKHFMLAAGFHPDTVAQTLGDET